MDKGLFANDGSFMERFKQMQQEKEKAAAAAGGSSSGAPNPVNPKQPVVAVVANKRPLEVKKSGPVGSSSGGKLAFRLKKAKIAVAPVFAPDDENDDAAVVQKEGSMKKPVQADKLTAAALTGPVAPPPPNDMTVRQVADKLACFVAKNGRQFENITRQRNPGDTPFKFLFDKSCPDYKYYEFQLAEEEKVLSQSKEAEQSQKTILLTRDPSKR